MGDVYRTTAADTGTKDENGNPVLEFNAKREAEEKRSEVAGGTHPMKGVTYREPASKFVSEYKDGKFTMREMAVSPGHEGGGTNVVGVARPGESLSQATGPDSLITDRSGDRFPVSLGIQLGWVRHTAPGVYEATPEGQKFLAGFNEPVSSPAKADDAAAAANTVDAATNTDTAEVEAPDALLERSESTQEFLSAIAMVVDAPHANAVVDAFLDNRPEVAEALIQAAEVSEVQRGRVEEVRQELNAKLDKVALDSGISENALPEALAWAEKERPKELRAARSAALDGRSGLLRSLAMDYNEARVERCAQHGEGVHVWRAPNKELMLSLPGYPSISYKSALAKGIIIVSDSD